MAVPRIYADGHVHLYPAFDRVRWARAACARAQTLAGPLLLLLCESQGHDYFALLDRQARAGGAPLDGAPTAPWLAATEEPESLSLSPDPSAPPSTFVVAGRQVVTSEGLEVLALARRLEPPEDRAHSAPELVRALLERGAIVVLPWGVGKWLGERGRRVDALVNDPELRAHPLFFVGDISHRTWPCPSPRPFQRGLRILAGTDVLPLRGLEASVASHGFVVQGALDPLRPAAALRETLRSGARTEPFGRKASPVRMLVEQLRLRLAGSEPGSSPQAP